jgi:hypothetical protein
MSWPLWLLCAVGLIGWAMADGAYAFAVLCAVGYLVTALLRIDARLQARGVTSEEHGRRLDADEQPDRPWHLQLADGLVFFAIPFALLLVVLRALHANLSDAPGGTLGLIALAVGIAAAWGAILRLVGIIGRRHGRVDGG